MKASLAIVAAAPLEAKQALSVTCNAVITGELFLEGQALTGSERMVYSSLVSTHSMLYSLIRREVDCMSGT